MSIAFNEATELTSQEWAEREQVIGRFEGAWRRGPRPDLVDYLPAGERIRRAVLRELVHTDLEYRIKDGEPVRIEEYLARFPELRSDPDAERELITAELELRRRRGPDPAIEEFQARFPEYPSQLVLTRRGMLQPGTMLPYRRDCPRCHEPFDVPADGHRDAATCPGCGAAIGFEWPLPSPLPSGERRLAKYDLLEEVGRGAFGIVYRARDTELDRIVALKVLRAGRLASPEEVDRFLREARSAAQLEHPHIVPVYDAGRAGETCYLACAFVPGMTLARRLAAGRVAPRDAATTAARVAEALHCAHLRGVVHRDVKPSNILLDPTGEPHLTDFGLARREAGEVTLTADGEPLGTPAYMPPEQARGEGHRVDGRGDLYSLGVVLYHMLTGELPFRGSNREMVLKQVLEEEPCPPRRLDDHIPCDLQTICLKCLEKQPASRYASAAAMAEDLHRFLRGEPIVARPVGRLKRLGGWCRRKPMVAGLLAGLLLAVSAGFSGVTWQWLRARREWHRAEANLHLARREGDRAEVNFRLARQAVDDYFNRVSANRLLDVPGMQPLRKELLESALEYYRRFVTQRADDPALRAELADAYFKIGFINSEIGSKEETLTAYQLARTIYEELARSHPADIGYRSKLASASYNMGVHLRATGQVAEALHSFRQALEIQEELAREHPDDPKLQTDWAAGHHNLGLLYFETGHPAEALDSLRRGIGILAERVAADPAVEDRAALAQYYVSIGAVNFETGHPADARGPWQRAIEILGGVTRDRPDVAIFRRDLAGTIMNLGALELETRHPAEAIRHFQGASGIQERLVRDNPAVGDYPRDLGMTYTLLADAHSALDRPAEALRPLEQARELRAKLVQSDPANLDCQSELGRTLSQLGGVLATLGRREEALAAFRLAHDHHRVAFTKGSQVVPYRKYLGEHYRRLAAAERVLGDPVAAASAALERRTLWPDDPAELFGVARDLALCIPLVGPGKRAWTGAEQAQRGEYSDLAMNTLQRAIAGGFQDLALLRSDTGLDPIRAREDFRRLLTDLMDRVFPSDPFAP